MKESRLRDLVEDTARIVRSIRSHADDLLAQLDELEAVFADIEQSRPARKETKR